MDCTNPNCCGPAQWPDYPSSSSVHLEEWCDSSLPPYTKLEFGVPSDDFILQEGGISTFFFFFFFFFFFLVVFLPHSYRPNFLQNNNTNIFGF